jgi:hypothetical protein
VGAEGSEPPDPEPPPPPILEDGCDVVFSHASFEEPTINNALLFFLRVGGVYVTDQTLDGKFARDPDDEFRYDDVTIDVFGAGANNSNTLARWRPKVPEAAQQPDPNKPPKTAEELASEAMWKKIKEAAEKDKEVAERIRVFRKLRR